MFRLVIGAVVCVVCLAWILAPGAWGKSKVGAFTATAAAVGSASGSAVAETLPVDAGMLGDAGMTDAAVAVVATSAPTAAPGTAATLAPVPPDLLVLLAAFGALAVLIMLLLALTGGLQRLPKEWRGIGAFGWTGLTALGAAFLGGLTLPEALAAGISAGLAAPGAFSVLKPLLGRLGPLGRMLGMAAPSSPPVRITVEMAMNDDPDKVIRNIFAKMTGSTSSSTKTPSGEKEGPK